jgi:hypothetical protein
MLTLRPAAPADLPVCAEFWLAMFEEIGLYRNADFSPQWRERFLDYFSRRIAAGEARYALALDGERIVGTAGAMLADGYPVIIHGLRSALSCTNGARVIDSTPPAIITSPSPHAMACAAELIACRLLPQSRFTVTPGTSTGKPASNAAMRATFRLSSPL